MHLSFMLDPDRMPGTCCLFERDELNADGGLEDGFLDRATTIRVHKDIASFATLLFTILKDREVRRILVSKNRHLVLDSSLRARVASASVSLDQYDGAWALATAGGLGVDGEHYCALYSSKTPFINANASIRPVVDTMADLYFIEATFCRDYKAANAPPLEHLLETDLILEGYRSGRLSLFLPQMMAGINGAFKTRGLPELTNEAQSRFAGSQALTIDTIAGRVSVEAAAPNRTFKAADPLRRPSPFDAIDFQQAIRQVVEQHLPRISLSIVTRTQFKRLYLLRRLLSTVSRALGEDDDVEVVLSTDILVGEDDPLLSGMRRQFPRVTIRLVVNTTHEHSRVRNMTGGLRAASKDYVWLVDDDDYIDLSALMTIRGCLFGGSRPIIFAGSVIHREVWTDTTTDFPVLASSRREGHWPASGWRKVFNGVNHVPICGMVMPRGFVLRSLDRFDFRYDLGEDYTLLLLLLTSPDLPPLIEAKGDIVHISIREIGENTVTVLDRMAWTRDITGSLFDLLYGPGSVGLGPWNVVAAGAASDRPSLAAAQVATLQAVLGERDRQIAALTRQVSALQEIASGNAGDGP